MTKVEVQADRLVAHVQGLDQVLALKSELTIPLAHVPGTDMPYVVIELDHERFANLVLEVEDPQTTAAAVTAALAGRL